MIPLAIVATVCLTVLLVVIVQALTTIATKAMTMLDLAHNGNGAEREAALESVVGLVQSTAANTAEAIGSAVSASLVPPPELTPTREQMIQNAAHELAQDYDAADDVDDIDPTDSFIAPGPRPDVASASRHDAAPFGVPGLHFPDMPPLLDPGTLILETNH